MINLKTDPKVAAVFDNYPPLVAAKLHSLRALILETASGIGDIEQLEETLKWGEPSYLSKHGSTIRIDWKEKSPDQCAIYFKCTSKLVPTFRSIFGDVFEYEKNRAIVLKLDQPLPAEELKPCISMALRYHKVKHLPLLGYEKP